MGSIDAARGSFHLVDPNNGKVLEGEVDLSGAAWDPSTWSAAALAGRTWTGNQWMGRTWTGGSWSGRTWTGSTWSGRTWSGRTWTGRTWTGGDWSGHTWSGTVVDVAGYSGRRPTSTRTRRRAHDRTR